MDGTVELSVRAPSVSTFELQNEVRIDAAPERVFECLLDITGWWGSPYLISREAKDIVLEPRPGGRVVEVWGQDEGCQWGTVTGIRSPRLLEITGTIGIDGPVLVVQRFEIEAADGGARVSLSLRAVGVEIPEGTGEGYGQGGADLLGRLKTFAESGTRQGLGNEPEWAKRLLSSSDG
jgi:uncharacterized protein YndB with AHSA1/START domain